MQNVNTTKGDKQATPTVLKQMIFKSEDIPNISIYDRLTRANGEVWAMLQPSKADGYLTITNLSQVE